MCGRFTLTTGAATLALLFQELRLSSTCWPELKPRYNICPTQPVLAVRRQQQQAAHCEPVWLRWGLVPSWADDLKIGARMINARSETVSNKPAFRAAFKSRRCLIVADGFYEWKTTTVPAALTMPTKASSRRGRNQTTTKQPYYIKPTGERPLVFAGLWESWTPTQQSNLGSHDCKPETIETCTILTTSANQIMQPLHDRMPVIVPPERFEFWLNADSSSDSEALADLFAPSPDCWLTTYPVSPLVNRPQNDSPSLLEAYSPPTQAPATAVQRTAQSQPNSHERQRRLFPE